MDNTKDLIDRIQDFNEVIGSVLSAAGTRGGGVILDADMIEILREHRILNNAALAGAPTSRVVMIQRANRDAQFFADLCAEDTAGLLAAQDEADLGRG